MGVTTALAKGGMVAARLPGYEVRPQQLAMAEAVWAAFDNNQHLIVEAGTGVGKSFAYLIPAIERVTREGGRVVVSTHTIALQEQLIDKDIPFLRSVFDEEFSAVLVKGRSNYLGLRRLQRASRKQDLLFDARGDRSSLHATEEWAYKTVDGSLGDLAKQPAPTVWDRVRSDADDCLGRRCPHFKKCFYQRARRRALGAQILVVNHAMLFSDLALRRQGASVLPDYEYVILDEAHTVERVAGDHMGLSTSNAQARHLFNTLYNERTGRGVLSSKAG
ncbi:MAG: ATP-dependent DNA helicase, partial [Phycisphaerae bacterium]